MAYVTTYTSKDTVLNKNGEYVKLRAIKGKPYRISDDLIFMDEADNTFQIKHYDYGVLSAHANDSGPSTHHFTPCFFRAGMTELFTPKEKLEIQMELGALTLDLSPFTVTVKALHDLRYNKICYDYSVAKESSDTKHFKREEDVLRHFKSLGVKLNELFKKPEWEISIPTPDCHLPTFVSLENGINPVTLTVTTARHSMGSIQGYTVVSEHDSFRTYNFYLALSHAFEVCKDPAMLIELMSED